MQIAFCDDNKQELQLMLDYAARYKEEHGLYIKTQSYADAETLLRSSDVLRLSAIFLDIYMEGISGVVAARMLREKGYMGAFVLVTNSHDHFADGYAVDASHYLLKPVEYKNFSEAMRRVIRLSGAEARMITVQSGRNWVSVPVVQIQFAEVYNHSTVLHLQAQTLKVRHALSELEDMLGGEPFLRCYRSYIVNMNYVERIDADSFVLKNGERVPIARDGRQEIQSRYLSYIFKRMEGI